MYAFFLDCLVGGVGLAIGATFGLLVIEGVMRGLSRLVDFLRERERESL
jgi:hypothetical protein